MKLLVTIVAFCFFVSANADSILDINSLQNQNVHAIKRRDVEAAENIKIEDGSATGNVNIKIELGAHGTGNTGHASELSTNHASTNINHELSSNVRTEQDGLKSISINLDDLAKRNHVTIGNENLYTGGSVRINVGGLNRQTIDPTSSSSSNANSAQDITVENSSEITNKQDIKSDLSTTSINTSEPVSIGSRSAQTNSKIPSEDVSNIKQTNVEKSSNNADGSKILINISGLGVDVGTRVNTASETTTDDLTETKTSAPSTSVSNARTAKQNDFENKSTSSVNMQQTVPENQATFATTTKSADGSSILINISGLGRNTDSHLNTESENRDSESVTSTENRSVTENKETVLETAPIIKPSIYGERSNIHIHFDGLGINQESKTLTTNSPTDAAKNVAVEKQLTKTENITTPVQQEIKVSEKPELTDSSKIQININGLGYDTDIPTNVRQSTASTVSSSIDTPKHVKIENESKASLKNEQIKTIRTPKIADSSNIQININGLTDSRINTENSENIRALTENTETSNVNIAEQATTQEESLTNNTNDITIEKAPVATQESQGSNIHIYIHGLNTDSGSKISETITPTASDTSRQTILNSWPITGQIDSSGVTSTFDNSKIQIANAPSSSSLGTGFGQLGAIHININGLGSVSSNGDISTSTEKITTTEQSFKYTPEITTKSPVTIATEKPEDEDQSDEVETSPNYQVNNHHAGLTDKIQQKLISKYNWVASKHAALSDHFKSARIVNKPVHKFNLSGYLNQIIQKKLNALNKLFAYKKSLFAHKFA